MSTIVIGTVIKDVAAERELMLKVASTELLRTMVQHRITYILEAANANAEYVPFSSYEYDLEVKGLEGSGMR